MGHAMLHFSLPDNPFTVDDESATDGCLYVDVAGVGVVGIYSRGAEIAVEIYGRGVWDTPVANATASHRSLIMARARERRRVRQ